MFLNVIFHIRIFSLLHQTPIKRAPNNERSISPPNKRQRCEAIVEEVEYIDSTSSSQSMYSQKRTRRNEGNFKLCSQSMQPYTPLSSQHSIPTYLAPHL